MSHGAFREGVMQRTPSFNPVTLAPFVFGDASQETGLTDGASTSVTDLSGNGNNLAAPGGYSSPTWRTGIVSGKPVYRFDGSSQFVQATFTLAQPYFVFLVMRVVLESATKDFCDGRAVNSGIIQYGTSGGSVRGYAGAFLQLSGTGAGPPVSWTVFHTLGFLFNGTSSEARLDGGGLVTGNIGSATPGGFTLASQGGGGSLAQIDVAAVGVFPVLSSTDRGSLESWARSKWGTP